VVEYVGVSVRLTPQVVGYEALVVVDSTIQGSFDVLFILLISW